MDTVLGSGHPRLRAVDSPLEVRRKVAPHLDLQLVAFSQDGYLRDPEAGRLLEVAFDRGVDVVVGIPHFEHAMAEGAESVRCWAGRPAPISRPCTRSTTIMSASSSC